jgi:carbon monoxide dehydrogenase subunit G
MSLRFEGERRFALPPEHVWLKLRDAAFLVQCIPDATVVGTPERDQAQCSVRPGFSFASGNLAVAIQILDSRAPSELKFVLASKGVGSSSAVECALTLSAADGGAVVRWIAEVKQLGGLLKMAPSGLIRGAAQKVIDDVWNGITAKLATLENESG